MNNTLCIEFGTEMEIPKPYLGRSIKCVSCRMTFTAYPLEEASARWTANNGMVSAQTQKSEPPPISTPNLSTSHIFILIGEEQRGPFALDQIRSMWESGNLTVDTLWWTEGMTEWSQIQSLPLSNLSARVSQQDDSPTIVIYNPDTDTFSGTTTLIVKLAMRAIQQLGWKLDSANESLGIVNFETGVSWGSWSGVSCTLTIEEVSSNTFRVHGGGKQNIRGGQFLAIDVGEAKGRAMKAIKKMQELSQE